MKSLSTALALLGLASQLTGLEPPSLQIIDNVGNGVGNTVVISNGPQPTKTKTILSNVKNGIGNRVVIINGKEVNELRQAIPPRLRGKVLGPLDLKRLDKSPIED